MQDKGTTESTFFQLFKSLNEKYFNSKLKDLEADKYTKKLITQKLFELVAIAQLKQHDGLRDISNSLENDHFKQQINLESISHSQISRRLRDLPTEALQFLLKSNIIEIGKSIGFSTISKEIGRLYLIDSSTISLCLSKYPWADFRNTKAGVKLHLRLKFIGEGVVPDKAIITPAKIADKTQLDEMVIDESDALHVFDRGYVDYRQYDKYSQKGIRFVTRLKSNAKIADVIKDYPVDPAGPIKKHQIVYLGRDKINKMEHPLRLIETEDTQGKAVIILSNDFDLTVEEMSDIYRHRWKIELFFKWIKQHFRVKHFYGTSPQAVANQLYIALITYCMIMLLKIQTQHKGPLLNIKRLLETCLLEPFEVFIQKLNRRPKRSSKGRRKAIDSEMIFQLTVQQVIVGETEQLYSISYDPIVL